MSTNLRMKFFLNGLRKLLLRLWFLHVFNIPKTRQHLLNYNFGHLALGGLETWLSELFSHSEAIKAAIVDLEAVLPTTESVDDSKTN